MTLRPTRCTLSWRSVFCEIVTIDFVVSLKFLAVPPGCSISHIARESCLLTPSFQFARVCNHYCSSIFLYLALIFTIKYLWMKYMNFGLSKAATCPCQDMKRYPKWPFWITIKKKLNPTKYETQWFLPKKFKLPFKLTNEFAILVSCSYFCCMFMELEDSKAIYLRGVIWVGFAQAHEWATSKEISVIRPLHFAMH